MALLAHTVVVGEEKVTGAKADVIRAAYDCLNAAVRTLKAGAFNHQVTSNFAKVTEAYGVNFLEGVLSHEIKRHLIDGNNVILGTVTDDQRVADVEFQVNQVYVLDCIVSNGSGKPKQSTLRTTVFKRSLDSNFDLKTRNARQFFTMLNERFPSLAFSLNSFDDEILARAGSNECQKAGLIDAYPVLTESKNDIVAHFKWTVLISNKRVVLLAHHLLDEESVVSDKSVVDEELKTLLAVRICFVAFLLLVLSLKF